MLLDLRFVYFLYNYIFFAFHIAGENLQWNGKGKKATTFWRDFWKTSFSLSVLFHCIKLLMFCGVEQTFSDAFCKEGKPQEIIATGELVV